MERIISSLDDLADLLTLATKETVSKSDLVHFIETTFSNVPALKEKIYNYLKSRLGIDLTREAETYRKLHKEEISKFLESIESEEYNLWDVYNTFTDVLSHTRRINLRTTVKLQEKVGEFLVAQITA